MRKAIKILSAITLALVLLTACNTNPETSVTDGKEVIIDIKDNQISKNDIYHYLKLRFGPNLITSNLIEMQLEKYVELDEDDKKEGQKRLDETKDLLKEEFESVIKASGYQDEEDYYNRVILSQIKNEKMFNQYIDENLDEIMTDLQTAKIKKIRTNSKPEAEAALVELNELAKVTVDDFESVANTYSQEEVIAQSSIEHVYENRQILKFLNDTLADAKPGLVNEVLMDGEVFYIIYIEEIDLEADKEMIVTSITQDESINQVVNETMFAHYSKDGNFEIHDIDLYDLLKESNPFLLK